MTGEMSSRCYLTMAILVNFLVFVSGWGKNTPQNYNETNDSWKLPLMKGIMKGQELTVRRLNDHPNKWHTCYEIMCEGKHCPSADDPNRYV